MQSYSSAILSKTVGQLIENERDLFDPSHSQYYGVGVGSQRDLAERYLAALAFRTANGLPVVEGNSFAADTNPSSGASFFVKVVNGSGIETTVTDDLIVTEQPNINSGKLASFITKESRKIPISRLSLVSRLATTEQKETKHLQITEPPVVSDEDPIIFNRMVNVHRYIRELIK